MILWGSVSILPLLLNWIQLKKALLYLSVSSLTSGFLNSGCALSSPWKWKCELLSLVWFFVTPWTVAHQTLLSMEFSKQEYCSGLPFSSPGELPDPGIEPWSPAGRLLTVWATREAHRADIAFYLYAMILSVHSTWWVKAVNWIFYKEKRDREGF